MGATADLQVPVTGATAQEPVPYVGQTPQQADAEAFGATAGEFRKGLRSGVNSLGAGALALAANMGEAAGLTNFAASRFAEAKDMASFADAVGPRVRDYRAVKDLTDAVNFVAGLSGQATGSTLPALALGAGGAARFGMRGAVAGAYTGSFIPEAGEQALTVADSPATPGERLVNSLEKGAVNAALDVASPGGAAAGIRRVATAGARGATEKIGHAALKGTAGEAVTEAIQEKVGQTMHARLDPARDSSDDEAAIINAALGGAAGGLTLGGGSAAAAKVPGALRQAYEAAVRKPGAPETPDSTMGTLDEAKGAIGTLDKPEDPNDLSGAASVDPEKIPDWLDLRDNELAKSAAKWYEQVKSQPWAKAFTDVATDPEQRDAFIAEVRDRFKRAIDHPAVRKAADSFKKFAADVQRGVEGGIDEVKKNSAEKPALTRTAVDLALYDNMLKHADPAKLEALSPTKRLELAGDLKTYMLASFGQRDPVEGPGAPVERRGFKATAPSTIPNVGNVSQGTSYVGGSPAAGGKPAVQGKPTTTFTPEGAPGGAGTLQHNDASRAAEPSKIEGGRETVPAQLPHSLMDLFPGKLQELLSSSHEILKAFGQPLRDVNYKKGVTGAEKSRSGYQTKLEDVVRSNLRDRWLADPDTREEVVRRATAELQKAVNEGPRDWKKFNHMAQELFAGRTNAVLDAFEAERTSITRAYEHFVDQEQTQQMTADEIAGKLAENPSFRVSTEDDRTDMTAASEPVSKADEDSPYRDRRLGVPYDEMTEAKHVMDRLRSDPSYDPKKVKFRAVPVIKTLADGTQQMTGKVTIEAEDAQASTSYSDDQWDRIQEKHGKAGLENGVVTIERYRELGEDGKPVLGKNGNPLIDRIAVSVPNLVAETSASIGQESDEPGFKFNMVRRGLSNLMSDPRFARFAGQRRKDLARGDVDESGMLNIPDSAVVTVKRNENGSTSPVTWGEVRSEARQGLREKEADYWGGVVSDLQSEATEYFKRKKRNPDYEDAAIEEYIKVRNARRAGLERSKEDYEQFVKEWAQNREEKASGFQTDETKGGGMVGIRAIEDAFDRENRLEHLEGAIKRAKTEIKGLRVERPEGFQEAIGEQERLIGRWEREVDRLQQGLSSTLKENEIEQTAPHYAASEERVKQDETQEELHPNQPRMSRAQAKRETAGGEGGAVRQVQYVRDEKGRPTGSRSEKLAENRSELMPTKGGKPRFSDVRLGKVDVDDHTRQEIREYVEKVLGTTLEMEFEQTVKTRDGREASGLFTKVDGVEKILISTRAIDPKSTAYHETMHALLSRLREWNPKAHNTLMAAAGSPHVVAQLRKLLADEPAALKQLTDPEERTAYMYAFWAARDKKGEPLLTLGPKATSVFQALKKFLRGLLDVWTELSDGSTDKAEKIMTAFYNGRLVERSAAGRVLDQYLPPDTQGISAKLGDWAKRVFYTADGYVRDMKNPAFTRIADGFLSPADQQGTPSGFMQVKHVRRHEFMNRYVTATKGLDAADMEKLSAALRSGKVPSGRALAAAHGAIRGLLDDVFQYMEQHNVKVVTWDSAAKQYREDDLHKVKDYFPRVYDKRVIQEKWGEFINMLKRNGIGGAEQVAQRMISGAKADPNESDWTAGLTYFAPNTMRRVLDIPADELAPYLKKDLGGTMYSYINYAVRRAEYASRFDNQGQKIAEAIEEAKRLGATDSQVNSFSQYVQAMEGSLGNEIDPKLKSFFGAVLTYQNFRLLPLPLFSSLVDPAGIVVRGGTMADALGAFVRGVRELAANKEDGAREFAMTVGAINAATDEQMIADAYGANFSEGWQRWMNNKLFKWNGMESWNNSMRIAGASAAERFIIKQVKKPGDHSERWLAELGLTKDDVRVVRGRLELTPVVVDAINKWVDGAVLRPHAGIRPIWMSDPHFMLVSHLKQFTYSFQKAIVARTVHEAKHGNVTPLLALTSYVPLIIAADILRAVVTPGGSDDDRLQKWGMVDWMGHGIARAGITGPGQYVFDAGRDLSHGGYGVESVLGPTAEQLVGFMRASVGAPGTDMTRELTRSLPFAPAFNVR